MPEPRTNGQEIAIRAPEWESKIELIKRVIAKGCTNDELELFLYHAKRTGLDPLAKQIHAIKRWSSQEGRDVMSIQTGIDGFRLIADRTNKYAPGKKPDFVERDDKLYSATAYVMKFAGDQWHEVSAEAFWDEYVQTKKDKDGTPIPTAMWKKMPHTMLAKCAEALALRKAFPAELSGLYTFDEMAQAANQESGSSGDVQGKDALEGFVTEIKQADKKGVMWLTVEDDSKTVWACAARTKDIQDKLAGMQGERVQLLVTICARPGSKTFCDIAGVMSAGPLDFKESQTLEVTDEDVEA